VWIAGFGYNASLAAPPLNHPYSVIDWPSVNSRYLAPGRYAGTFRYNGAFSCVSDIFVFGLILFEILPGRSVFQENLTRWQITCKIGIEGARPEISDSVLASPRSLIEDCSANDPDERPTFEEIVDRLAEMRFRVTVDVNSAKVAEFVKRIEDREKQNRKE
jgi:serine/threonine protein kinase